MKALAPHLQSFSGKRILVVGDVMLDEFLRGDVKRISPEAPVPVLEVRSRDHRLGGAANAAANVQALGGNATVIGLVGQDTEGDVVDRLLRDGGLGASLVRDPARPTTRKTRLVARGQQMVRADSESREAPQNEALSGLLQAIDAGLANADGCILSDYAKGVVSPAVAAHLLAGAAKRGIPVVVDPKHRDFALYRGATVITPNQSELELAAGTSLPSESAILAATERLLPLLGGGAILATRGADGMTLVRPGLPPIHARATAKAVFDVTGAGDTVVATLALSLATHVPFEDAIILASVAAGVVVSKEGTATVTPEELREALHEV